MKIVDLNYIIEGLGQVFPRWEEACIAMKPYADVIWKTGRIPADNEKFPLLDWEESGSKVAIFGIKGVVDNQGTLDIVRKRGRTMTIGEKVNKRARSVTTEVEEQFTGMERAGKLVRKGYCQQEQDGKLNCAIEMECMDSGEISDGALTW